MIPTRTGLFPAEKSQPAFRAPRGFHRRGGGATSQPDERSQRTAATAQRHSGQARNEPTASPLTTKWRSSGAASLPESSHARGSSAVEEVETLPLDRDVVLAPYWHALKFLGFDHVAVWRTLPPEEREEAFRLCGIEKLGHQWYVMNKYCSPPRFREGDVPAPSSAAGSSSSQRRTKAVPPPPPELTPRPTSQEFTLRESRSLPKPQQQRGSSAAATQTQATAISDERFAPESTDTSPLREVKSDDKEPRVVSSSGWHGLAQRPMTTGAVSTRPSDGDGNEEPNRISQSPERSADPGLSKRKLKLVLHHRLLTPSSASRSRSRSPKTRKHQQHAVLNQRVTSPLGVAQKGAAAAALPTSDQQSPPYMPLLSKPLPSTLVDEIQRVPPGVAVGAAQTEQFWSALQSPPASSLHDSAAYRRLQMLLSLSPRAGGGTGGGSRSSPSHRRRSTSPKRDDDGYTSAVASEWMMEAARRRFLSPHRPNAGGGGGGYVTGGDEDSSVGVRRSATRPLSPFHIGF